MTTPQSGREAFEAWFLSEHGHEPRLSNDGHTYFTHDAQVAYAAWQAALAQQGREVGEAVGFPGMELVDELWPAVPIYEFDFGDEGRERYIRLAHVPKIKALYTAAPKQQGREAVTEKVTCVDCGGKGYTDEGDPEIGSALMDCEMCDGMGYIAAPKQRAVEVTEEMVDRACNAFYVDDGWRFNKNGSRDDIRAALLAALPGKTEVDRG